MAVKKNLGQNLNIADPILMYNFSFPAMLLWPSGLSTGFVILHVGVRLTPGAIFLFSLFESRQSSFSFLNYF